jgi:hypothetical protein
MKYLFITILSTFFFFSCSKKSKVSNHNDYKVFLNTKNYETKKQHLANEEAFWKNKLAIDAGNVVFLQKYAQSLLSTFEIVGDVNVLPKADSLLLLASEKLKNTEATIFYKLAQNAIKQHQFKKAKSYLLETNKLAENAYTKNLLLFDVNMELGDYTSAFDNLTILKSDTNNFNYLIRASKYQDHLGNADATLQYMETAYNSIMKTNNIGLQSWVCTNLADMYGHNNYIDRAYHLYIKALQIDTFNLHALKGIASIEFNHDLNTTSAKNLYSFIKNQTQMPDVYLDLADIADYEGNEAISKSLKEKFIANIASNKNYGNMYNVYLINLYSNDLNKPAQALEIANNEILNRATPETYGWLAYAHFKNNNTSISHQLYKNYVYNKTHEPNQAFLGYQIFKNKDATFTKNCKLVCMDSKFELGVNNMKQIN